MRKLLVDTDTASDDAVAIIMALRSPEVEVAGITVVAGNVALEQATSNALFTAELCGSNVPIFRGAAKPLLRKLEIADWFHGADGLGDHGYAPTFRKAENEHAVEAIVRLIDENPGLEMITLGPLTNVALALQLKPDLAGKVNRCVVMGGAPCCEGNVTPAAEFNIWVDPEAARIVFRSGLPIEMVGWQLCRGAAVINADDIAAIEKLTTKWGDFAVRCNSTARGALLKQTGEEGICLPDPVAMSILLHPSLSEDSSLHHVDIETSSVLTRGMTVVDRLDVASDERNKLVWGGALTQRKIEICWKLNVDGWKAALLRALQ